MRRLYLQVYFTIVASLVLVVITAGLLWHFSTSFPPLGQQFAGPGEIIAELAPPADASPQAQQQAIERLAERIGTDLALFSRSNERLASAGRRLPAPGRSGQTGGWVRSPGGPAVAIPLPDGRRLVARIPSRPRPGALMLAAFLGAIALVVALGAGPVVRRLTGRLERLQHGVASLGAGGLRARGKGEGRGGVARLAQSFNQAAARIESLVDAHKMLLANASHELRTPLTRIRLGLELAGGSSERKAELEKDIAELHQVVEESLLASRLDSTEQLDVRENVDLAALAAEECARYDDCTMEARPVTVHGDPALLRRMIRNLVENAQLHGQPPIEVTVDRQNDLAVLRVCDHGPVIAESARERLFSMFY